MLRLKQLFIYSYEYMILSIILELLFVPRIIPSPLFQLVKVATQARNGEPRLWLLSGHTWLVINNQIKIRVTLVNHISKYICRCQKLYSPSPFVEVRLGSDLVGGVRLV